MDISRRLTKNEVEQIRQLKLDIEELSREIENSKDIIEDGTLEDLREHRNALIDILHGYAGGGN